MSENDSPDVTHLPPSDGDDLVTGSEVQDTEAAAESEAGHGPRPRHPARHPGETGEAAQQREIQNQETAEETETRGEQFCGRG